MASMDVSVIIKLVDQLSAPAKRAASALKGVQDNLEAMGSKMRAAGRTMTLAVTGPLVGLGAMAFKTGAEIEQTLNRIVGLAGVGRETLAEWVPVMETLSRETGRPLKEIADAIYFISSSGVAGRAAIDTLEMAAKASAAGLGQTQVIADAVTSALNAYGTANITAAKATDILIAAVKEGKGEADQIAGVLGNILPLASELGVGFDQVAAGIAAMTQLGAGPEEAATSMQAMLSGLLKPSKQASDALAEFGLSADGLRKQLRDQGLLSVLQTLRETFGDNEQAMALVFENVRALRGALNLVGQNAEKTKGVFASVANSAGSLAHAYKETEGAARQMDRARAEMELGLKRIGDAVIPALVPILNKVASLLGQASDRFSKLSESTKMWTVGVAGLAAAIGPATWAIGGMLTGLGKLLALLRLAAFTPVGLAITAIAGAILLLYQNSEKLRPAWEALTESAGKLLSALRPIGEAINSISQALTGQTIGSLFEGLSEAFVNSVAGALQGVANALEAIAAAINTIREAPSILGGLIGGGGGLNLGMGMAEKLLPAPDVRTPQPQSLPVPRSELQQGAASQWQRLIDTSSGWLADLKNAAADFIGGDMPATAAATAPVRGTVPPGFTIEANGPSVTVKQAPPSVVNNITVQVATDADPQAIASAVANEVAKKTRASMFDGIHE